jgi:iron complex transport system substrate-binding protein
VSLSPSTTEAVFAIDAGGKLVGRSRYCDYPPEVKALPQVGGYVDPSLEAILALDPDLVIGARGPAGSAIADRLGARGIDTFFPKTESFAEIEAMIDGLGKRLGREERTAARLAELRSRVKGIESAVAPLPVPTVLLVFGFAPLSVAGPTSFPDEMIRRAGGKNVVTEGGAYPTFGVEHVLALDPDLVINAAIAESMGKHKLDATTPGWGKLRAIKEGKIVALEDEVVLRPGPRIGDGLATLARALHPRAEIP